MIKMYTKQSFEDMMKSEKEVADYLSHFGVFWEYERPVFVYDDKGRPRVWTPDFYLSQLCI